MSPHETLAATSSLPNPETLAMHEVLAHPHTTFHPCTCGLCGGAAVVDSALIGYDSMNVDAGTITRRRS
jgi:hypothetical protein